MLMRFLSLFILLLTASAAAAADDARPSGTNCQLTSPPAEAGEEFNHGITIRIFPRAKDIGPSYTGCQVTFVPNGESWVVLSLTEIVKGDPVRMWSEHTEDQSTLTCRFRKGKLIRGKADNCPAPQFLLVKSLAPGCVQQIKAAVAKDGIGATLPSECEYQ